MAAIETIGRYEVARELGRGGMAVVYLAHDPYVKRDVAVKVLTSQHQADSTFLQRFKREAETVAALEHATIVPIYDYGQHEGRPFIVMRYMPGGSLEDRLQEGALTMKQIAPVIQRVAAALDVAHGRGVIHRDIKPANIMFNNEGEALLSDFGIAKHAQEGSGLTGDESFLGTVEYMSPEQIQGQEVDGRTDIYALGIVLYRMLTGDLPFFKNTVISTALAHVTDPIPSIQEALPNSRVPWDEVLHKALAKDPDERYQQAGQMAADVSAFLSGKWYLSRLDNLLD